MLSLSPPFEANVNSMPMQKSRSYRCLYSKKRLTPQEFLIFKVQGKGEYRNVQPVLEIEAALMRCITEYPMLIYLIW